MADTEAPPAPVDATVPAASFSNNNNNSKSKANYAEVQETMSRLAAHKGVTSVLILNRAGDILTQTGQGMVGNPKLLKKTLDAAAHYIQSIPNEDDAADTATAAAAASQEGEEGESTSTITSNNEKNGKDILEKLSFVRIRSKREEILVAPKNQYVLVVIQDPNLSPL